MQGASRQNRGIDPRWPLPSIRQKDGPSHPRQSDNRLPPRETRTLTSKTPMTVQTTY